RILAEAEVEDVHLVSGLGSCGGDVAHAERRHRVGAPLLVRRDEEDAHGQEAAGVVMASEANELGSGSGKRSDDRRGAARGTRAGCWAPQEGGASSHLAARLPPRSPGSFAAAAMATRTPS